LHACCRYNHFALEAVLALRRAHRFDADDVVRLRVTTIPFAARMTDAEPGTTLAAKFSIPYAVAAALALGRTDVVAFPPPAVGGPGIGAGAAEAGGEAAAGVVTLQNVREQTALLAPEGRPSDSRRSYRSVSERQTRHRPHGPPTWCGCTKPASSSAVPRRASP